MGFGGIIMHGVYLYNCIAHEIVKRLGKGIPTNIREVSARFKSVVRPGDVILVNLWRICDRQHWMDNWEEVRWNAVKKDGGEVCLSDGRALVSAEGTGAESTASSRL